jgi:hypothetical protein
MIANSSNRCEAVDQHGSFRLGTAAWGLQSNVGGVPKLPLMAPTGGRQVNIGT